MRYAQRIDVDEWRYYVPDGVSVKGLNKIPRHEIQLAVFRITKGYFDRISKKMVSAHGSLADQKGTGKAKTGMEDSAVQALEKKLATSQGFLLDSKLRKALEDYSMDAARQHFESLGYVVEDHSKNHPYDFLCTRSKETLYVEVKGTQTNGEG